MNESKRMRRILCITFVFTLMVGCASSFVVNSNAGKDLGWIKASSRFTGHLSSSSGTVTTNQSQGSSEDASPNRRPRYDNRRNDNRRNDRRRRGPPRGRPGMKFVDF